jgi:hypothetical protein
VQLGKALCLIETGNGDREGGHESCGLSANL